jgi:hypothetical protein
VKVTDSSKPYKLPQCSKVTFASVLALKKMNAIRNRKTMPTLEANFAVLTAKPF